MPFSVGDRVRCIRVEDDNPMTEGAIGTVRAAEQHDPDLVGVEFDNFINGNALYHRGEQLTADGRGWWCQPESLERLEPYQERNARFIERWSTTTSALFNADGWSSRIVEAPEPPRFVIDDWTDPPPITRKAPTPTQPRNIGEFFKRLNAAEGK